MFKEKLNHMKKSLSFVLLFVVLASLMAGCAAPTPEVVEVEVTKEVIKEVEVVVTPTAEPVKNAKYVFLFIGDGMAVAQRNAAELYLAETTQPGDRPEDTDLLMNTLPAQGMNTTYDLTSVIPDSASTATAIASGFKTASGVIGMNPDGTESYKNIAEVAKENGWKVGVISSVSIDHATPAAFYAHQASRNDYYEISMQISKSGFDYFAGGPAKYPTGKEKDKPSVIEAAAEAGYMIVDTNAAFDTLKAGDAEKVWIMNETPQDGKAMHYDMDRAEGDPSLADYVAKGIEVLDNEDGFFMMVEGGKIDWACHANDAAASIHDTLALDAALAEAMEFYEQHPDETLIIVTGDHETGGLTIGFAGTAYDSFVSKIANQSMSYVEFDKELAAYKESTDAAKAKLEDLLPQIEAAFGLKRYTAEEMAAFEAAVEAGDAEAEAKLGMAITDIEWAILQEAFAQSMLGEEERSEDEYTYLLYGGYEPLSIKLTTLLNQKAGIAWTSYSHTGVPVQTSAIGVGSEQFNGYYDQTDINVKMMDIAGFAQ